MMNFFIFFVLLSFFVFSVSEAHALLVSADPVAEMDVVVVGMIVSAVPGTDSYGVPETTYFVDVEEIIKGSTMLEDGTNTKSLEFVSPGVLDEQNNPIYRKIFAINDRVLLMLEQRDGNLHESLWSRDAPNNCSGNNVIQMFSAPKSLSISQDKPDDSHFYMNRPISVQYSFFNKNLTATVLNVTINVVDDFPDIYHSESFVLNLDECHAYETVETKFTMNEPSSISIHTVVDGEYSHGVSGLDVIEYVMTPLKQIKNGVALVDVRCNEGKSLVYKYDRMMAGCVDDETEVELISRGWALLRLGFPDYSRADYSSSLCGNYGGKWHSEYDGCRGDISDLQCSLMGGKFVDNLKICSDGICPADKTYTLCMTNSTLIPTKSNLPPCTSDRTACFNQDENLCDPSGWKCGGNEGIFEDIIESDSDESSYDLEMMFHEEEYAVEYVINGNAEYVEIDIPADLIDGVFMVYVNDENVDDERVSIDGNKVTVNYGQNIESVKLFGSHELGGLENEN